MFNAFLKYEQDFSSWVDADFPGIGPLSRDFLEHLRTPKDGKRMLWPHQMEGVQRTIYAYELLQIKEALLNIVTGGGKTSIIGAVVAWLKYAHSVHKFLLLCPNTIVRDRLEDDFIDAKIFRTFGFFPAGAEHYTNELETIFGRPVDVSTRRRIEQSHNRIRKEAILGNTQTIYESR